MKKTFIFICILFGIVTSVKSQVTIYPYIIFVDPITRSGSVRLMNNSDGVVEVQINADFGYKRKDTTKTEITATDSLMEQKYSLLKYLKIFPKKLILQPKKDQMVRFLVMHPPSLPDGTYTANITVITQPMQKQVDTTDKKNISMGLILRTAMITMVVYQKGSLTTSLELKDMNSSTDSSNLKLTFGVEQNGNSPFWGKARISIIDTQGMVVDTLSELFGIYCSTQRSFTFKKDKFKPGNYFAQIQVSTDREDIPDEKIIRTSPVTRKFEFAIP